jgi:hypothetical protein
MARKILCPALIQAQGYKTKTMTGAEPLDGGHHDG